ncbi:MAG: C10 family peptidase [Bacteroidota bacterium]
MIRIRLYLILCLSLIWFDHCPCQSLAERTARDFLARREVSLAVKSLSGFDKTGHFGNIWIFERHDPDGFVLVKETDTLRIVGYSLQNRFYRGDSLNSTAKTFLEALSSARELDFLDNPLKTHFNPAGPFLQTQWSQDEFFNFYCPEDDQALNGHVYVGCAAVAMGQILRYYGKFNEFLFQVSAENYLYGELTSTLGNFDWMGMENVPITLDTEVCRLLFGLGVLTDMSYGPTASSTSNYMVYEGFKKLKYFDAVRMARSSTERSVWVNNFYQDIADSKPIYVSGSGHSFVCDGIDAEGLFHFNLGWYGYGDGYYPLDLVMIINPSEAIFKLAPYNTLYAPVNLITDTSGGSDVYRWSDDALSPESPTGYRVYMNDTLFYETSGKYISGGIFPPGNHRIMVSSLYPSGESRWVGPIVLNVPGPRIVFEDAVLEDIIVDELQRMNPSSVISATSDQVLNISSISIDKPVNSLKGLESCKNLQVLNISGSGQEIDFSPVSTLKRLKSLSITNILPGNIQQISKNDHLFELQLDKVPLSDLSFLPSLRNLLILYIKDILIPDPETTTNLSLLEGLTLSGCGITQTGFVQSLTRLKHLDLSNNEITRIRWTDKISRLQSLNLSNNQLPDLFFLDKLPVIRDLNVSHNQVTRFTTGQIFYKLASLDLSFNEIDSIFLLYPADNLRTVNVRGNHIRTISGLKNFAPGIVQAILSDNDLPDLWSGCLQNLSYLDISNNRITHLLTIPDHPSLTHLSCQGNLISDLYPLVARDFYKQLDHLDVEANPLTPESMDVFVPRMSGSIDTLLLPEKAEPRSPGYPVPARNGTVTGNQAELFWEASANPDSVSFELLTGDTQENMVISQAGFHVPSCTIDVNPGHTYYWAVRSVYSDTAFTSGIFNFHTYVPATIPLSESFESYPLFSYIPDVAPGWINPDPNGTPVRDGRIINHRRYEGRQSLSIGTETGLLLPLDHLAQKNIKISQRFFIETGKKGCFKVKNINGSDLELYFKSNGRCDMLLNQKIQCEIEYPRDQWFNLEISAYGSIGLIAIKIGTYHQELPWLFPTQIAHIGEIEYSGSSGPYYPQDGFPLYYVDNLEISASGIVSDQKELFCLNPVIYPNPADDYINVTIPGGFADPKPVLFDNSGKRIYPDFTSQAADRIRINTEAIKPGIYYLDLINYPGFAAARILIVH